MNSTKLWQKQILIIIFVNKHKKFVIFDYQLHRIDKSKAMSMVLHCADISHPAKEWDLHYKWTCQLLEEFFLQGDKEKQLGLPFSPLCDRNNTLIAESQIGWFLFHS